MRDKNEGVTVKCCARPRLFLAEYQPPCKLVKNKSGPNTKRKRKLDGLKNFEWQIQIISFIIIKIDSY